MEKPTACQECGQPMKGRRGKKFCSDQCRAAYHNTQKSEEEKKVLQLNSILRKNRSILKKLNPEGYTNLRQEVLKQMGFDFRFYTHQFKTDKGEIYYFCYEWGYQVLQQQAKVLIVQWQKYMKPFSPLL
jgi:predicted nucleic acid-binding Zn ribbon protein